MSARKGSIFEYHSGKVNGTYLSAFFRKGRRIRLEIIVARQRLGLSTRLMNDMRRSKKNRSVLLRLRRLLRPICFSAKSARGSSHGSRTCIGTCEYTRGRNHSFVLSVDAHSHTQETSSSTCRSTTWCQDETSLAASKGAARLTSTWRA